MDTNNTPYFLLRSAAEFDNGANRLGWNQARQALVLAQDQVLRLPATDPTPLDVWNAAAPLALDRFGQVARIDAGGSAVEANGGRGFLPLQDRQLETAAAPVGRFDDLALGGDGRLAAPFSNGVDQHGLMVFHLASRWMVFTNLEMRARRVWVDGENRIWCLGSQDLAVCSGQPLPLDYTTMAGRFEPTRLNPHELRPVWQRPLPDGWRGLAVCAHGGHLYVLCHNEEDAAQQVLRRPLQALPDTAYDRFTLDEEIPFVIDLAPAGRGRLAALAPWQANAEDDDQRDCPVVELVEATDAGDHRARLVRERYPMLSLAMTRFVSSADEELRYQAAADPDAPQIDPRPRELHPLRRPRYYPNASALLRQVLDSGQPETLWHRIYLDALIPHGCDIRLAVRVFDALDQQGSAEWIMQPKPIWNPLPSELPFGQPLAPQRPGEGGLFEVLLQREDGPVRRINGRFMQIEVHFSGNGRRTPALYALRAYAPRFSYQEAYLPEFFRQEHLFDPDNALGPANAADVRERFLAALESILSPIEARVAASDRLINPAATPALNLPWLAELLGARLATHWPAARQRRQVAAIARLQQFKGSLDGINRALDIASDGGIRRGEIVVLENFRLRRTMATILGIAMDDEDHPLTLGSGMSGNSLVGESLILSESDARTFLALFNPQLADEDEAKAVKAFFDRYGHQVSILLHGRGIGLRSRVEDVLADQMPAHVQWRIIETDHPFVLGIAPLLDVDTFLETTPDVRRAVLDDTRLGKEGVLENPAAFSPQDVHARGG